MPRIRTVKPELAKHELLFDLEQETGLPLRFAWAMLPTIADREGRFRWRPRALKSDILPYDDVDFSRVLHAWLTRGLLVRYACRGEWYGWIPTFRKHQTVNNKERESDLPSIDDADEIEDYREQEKQLLPNAWATREPRDDDASPETLLNSQAEQEQEGEREQEGKGIEVPPPSPSLRSVEGVVTSCAALPGSAPPNVFIRIPLVDGSEHPVTAEKVAEWVAAYPAVDVEQALREIRQWNVEHPRNRKTARGIGVHIAGWLARRQNQTRPDGHETEARHERIGQGQRTQRERKRAALAGARAALDP